jgi:hypothetical protein
MLANRVYIPVIVGIIAIIVIIAFFFATNSPILPDSGNNSTDVARTAQILPLDSEPYGISYGEWNGNTWKHFQEISVAMNPANDATGEFCDLGQDDPNVWYLHSTFGGKQVRECTIPENRSLVILIAGVSCSYAEDPTLQTSRDLQRCAEENVETMTLRASINGVGISNVTDYYSVSPPLKVTFPENNVWDVQGPVESEFVAAGWTLITEPLAAGSYVIETSAEERQFAATGEPPWSTAVEYHLTVVPFEPRD